MTPRSKRVGHGPFAEPSLAAHYGGDGVESGILRALPWAARFLVVICG
jgi:hypothetical protein